MPAGGAASRANQKTALAAVIHEKQVDPALGDILRQLEMEIELQVRVGVVLASTARSFGGGDQVARPRRYRGEKFGGGGGGWFVGVAGWRAGEG